MSGRRNPPEGRGSTKGPERGNSGRTRWLESPNARTVLAEGDCEARTQMVRAAYHDWLGRPRPWDPSGKHVAGGRTRKGMVWGAQRMHDRAASWEALATQWADGSAPVWIWSDHHLFHRNICAYTGRPFDSLDRMHETMLEAAQAAVGADDWLVFLGDVSFGPPEMTAAWLRACPGRKVLVLGNHDLDNQRKLEALETMGFEAITDCLALKAKTVETANALWLAHYPMGRELLPSGVIQVHGHIHDELLGAPYVNASVEHTGYGPVRLEDLLAQHQAARPRVAVDRRSV